MSPLQRELLANMGYGDALRMAGANFNIFDARLWIDPCQLWSKNASTNVESCSTMAYGSRYLMPARIYQHSASTSKMLRLFPTTRTPYMKFAHDLGTRGVAHTWGSRRTGIVGICEALFSVRRSCGVCRFLGRHAKEPRVGGSVSVATLPAVRKANAAFQKCWREWRVQQCCRQTPNLATVDATFDVTETRKTGLSDAPVCGSLTHRCTATGHPKLWTSLSGKESIRGYLWVRLSRFSSDMPNHAKSCQISFKHL